MLQWGCWVGVRVTEVFVCVAAGVGVRVTEVFLCVAVGMLAGSEGD